MKVLGLDFTSAPRPGKPITCLHCTFDGELLRAGPLEEWPSFAPFEAALRASGPWIAGIDCPFGQARRFIETIGWPRSWDGYVAHARSLGRPGFRAALDTYRGGRAPGDKEHKRRCDVPARAVSAQKLYGVPVGLMFFEGAPRLREAGVTIPHLQRGDPDRIAVEAYPALIARRLIGRRSYKQDTRAKQSAEQANARETLLAQILDGALSAEFGFRFEANPALAADPAADRLDALLCAIQASWAWRERDNNFGAPPDVDALEGWIADPSLSRAAQAT